MGSTLQVGLNLLKSNQTVQAFGQKKRPAGLFSGRKLEWFCFIFNKFKPTWGVEPVKTVYF